MFVVAPAASPSEEQQATGERCTAEAAGHVGDGAAGAAGVETSAGERGGAKGAEDGDELESSASAAPGRCSGGWGDASDGQKVRLCCRPPSQVRPEPG